MTKNIFSFLLFGIICLWMALKQKRNPLFWFCIGGYFGFVGVAFLAVPSLIRILLRKRKRYTPPSKTVTTIDVTAASKRKSDHSID